MALAAAFVMALRTPLPRGNGRMPTCTSSADSSSTGRFPGRRKSARTSGGESARRTRPQPSGQDVSRRANSGAGTSNSTSAALLEALTSRHRGGVSVDTHGVGAPDERIDAREREEHTQDDREGSIVLPLESVDEDADDEDPEIVWSETLAAYEFVLADDEVVMLENGVRVDGLTQLTSSHGVNVGLSFDSHTGKLTIDIHNLKAATPPPSKAAECASPSIAASPTPAADTASTSYEHTGELERDALFLELELQIEEEKEEEELRYLLEHIALSEKGYQEWI